MFARGSGLNSVKTVGLDCPDVSDRYTANAIAYLEKNLRKYGYDSILMCSGFDYEGKVEAVKILLDRRIDAMILVGSHYAGDCGQNDIQYLKDAAQKVPVVLMNGYVRVPGVYCVLTDNYKAVYDTVCNLIEVGRKKIVFLYDANSYSTTKKLEGYQDALIDNGLKVQEEYKVFMPNNVLKARDLLAKKRLDFDAVIASDDAMAVGALKYVHQINKSIPEDVNVVGLNNSELCVCCYPEMSSIDSQEELSEIAVDSLIKVLAGKSVRKKWRFHVNFLGEIQHSSNIKRITVKSIKKVFGCFQNSDAIGKIQQGSAWWFNDNKTGMEKQMTSLANLGLLGNFLGMLTDSRSFLSYSRHEYFRRIMCNLIGTWVENGEYPYDKENLTEIVKGISYNNAVRYFGFDL